MPYYKLNMKPTYFRSQAVTLRKFSTLPIKNNYMTFLLLLFLATQCFAIERTTKRVPQQVQRESNAIQPSETSGSEGLNLDCDEESEFQHSLLGCVSCRVFCTNSTTKFCRVNCRKLCKEDEFFHPVTETCVSCSKQCSPENLKTQGAREFCLNNCPVKAERCKPGELHYEKNNTCIPCSNVCNSKRKEGYCRKNCPGYQGYQTESLDTTTVLFNINSTVSTPDIKVEIGSLHTMSENMPLLVIALVVIIVLACTVIALVSYLACKCKAKRRNSELRNSNPLLYKMPVVETNQNGSERVQLDPNYDNGSLDLMEENDLETVVIEANIKGKPIYGPIGCISLKSTLSGGDVIQKQAAGSLDAIVTVPDSGTSRENSRKTSNFPES